MEATRKYNALGIRAEWKNNTINGASRYSLLFCERDGRIRGPYIINGFMRSYWGISSGDNVGGAWEIETRTTKSGREVVHKITKTA